MGIDFYDKPVENELDRMFDYDADGTLSPLEQSCKLDFITGDIEGDVDEDDCESDSYTDYDDDEDSGYRLSEEAIRRQDEMLKRLDEARKRRKARKSLIICGIMITSCIIFASSPGIILFIGAMLFSAKMSKII